MVIGWFRSLRVPSFNSGGLDGGFLGNQNGKSTVCEFNKVLTGIATGRGSIGSSESKGFWVTSEYRE